jgi:transcriptional regulator with XRE-family HTH domain
MSMTVSVGDGSVTYIGKGDEGACKDLSEPADGGPISRAPSRGKLLKNSDHLALVAARFRVARVAFNPSQVEVAKLLGITPQLLNHWEKGRNYPHLKKLADFCDMTGCTVGWIIRGIMEERIEAQLAVRVAVEAPHLVQLPQPEGKPRRRAKVDAG